MNCALHGSQESLGFSRREDVKDRFYFEKLGYDAEEVVLLAEALLGPAKRVDFLTDSALVPEDSRATLDTAPAQ